MTDKDIIQRLEAEMQKAEQRRDAAVYGLLRYIKNGARYGRTPRQHLHKPNLGRRLPYAPKSPYDLKEETGDEVCMLTGERTQPPVWLKADKTVFTIPEENEEI